MTVGAFGYLSPPILPSHSEATSPLFSGLPTFFLPGFVISAVLLPGRFVTRGAVPDGMDRLPGLSPSCRYHAQQCREEFTELIRA